VLILGAWVSDSFTRARDNAMFVLGWAGICSWLELLAKCWEHVVFCEGRGVVLFFPSFLTDPSFGAAVAWVLVARAPGHARAICPVRTLRDLQSYFLPATGPLFRLGHESAHALSKTTVGVWLRKALQQASIPRWDLYAAHSMRAEGATHAARVGVPPRLVQAMGCWQCYAVRMYLYHSPSDLWGASGRMLNA